MCNRAMWRCVPERSSGPAQVGLLAAVGRERVLVHPRPRLSVLSVGGELVDVSRTPGNGQVYDVNSYALAAAGRDAGAEVNRVGIVDSDPKKLREAVEGQLSRAEAVVIAGAVGGVAAEGVRRVLSDLGEMEVTRIAMHPGSVQGFGQLGADRVPVFLLPANPVSALVVFEVMVRPLIRLSLGKRQPMRRIVEARTLAPISSVSGRKGFLRGQLMRDQDTGEYLVQALGGAPGAVVAPAGDAGRSELPGDRSQRRRTDPDRRNRRRRVPCPARLSPRESCRRGGGVHPGWPMTVGPLRVAAGVVRLRPVRMRDAGQWSRTRIADREFLEPWEPSAESDWDARHTVSSWPSVCSERAGRSAPRPDAAVRDRGRRPVPRAADHRQCHPRRTPLGVDRLLGAQRGHRRGSRHRRGGAGAGPLLRVGDAAPR